MSKRIPTVRSDFRLISFWGVLLTSISVIGIIVSALSIWRRISEPLTQKLEMGEVAWAIVLILYGICLGATLTVIYRRGWRPFSKPLTFSLKERRFHKLLLVALVIGLTSILLSAVYSEKPSSTYFDRVSYAFNRDPGGIFALFTGFATLAALGLTLHSIWEIRGTITSFPDLMDRLCIMLNNASAKNRVRMVCYTPALGALALPESDYNRFSDSITAGSNGKSRAEIICLGDDELSMWHDRFVGRWTLRGEVTLEMTEKATASAKAIIKKLDDDAVKYLPFQFMPGCYFFFTRTHAIVVAPLFLQYPKGAPQMSQQSAPPVDMMGFETSDRGIINTLEQMYRRYKELPSTLIGEATADVEIQAFKNWHNGGLNIVCDEIGHMVEQLEAQFQRSIQGGYRELLHKENSKIEMDLQLFYKDAGPREGH